MLDIVKQSMETPNPTPQVLRDQAPQSARETPDPDLQVLHDRAAESARETRQGVVTLATGSLAAFFIALTSKVEPALSPTQKVVVAIALISMAGAIFAGLWSAYADAQWSYYWGKEIELRQRGENTEAKEKLRAQWHGQKRWSEKATFISFVVGVAIASIYLILRVIA